MYDRPNLFVLVSPVYRSCFFQRAPQVSNNYLNNRELTGQGSIYDYQIVQCLLAGIVAYIAGDTWTHSLWKYSVLNSFKKKINSICVKYSILFIVYTASERISVLHVISKMCLNGWLSFTITGMSFFFLSFSDICFADMKDMNKTNEYF